MDIGVPGAWFWRIRCSMTIAVVGETGTGSASTSHGRWNSRNGRAIVIPDLEVANHD